MYEEARQFLDKVLPTEGPFVTLTYAQSLDGKIARKGEQLILSGKESMAMTHRLRILHDGIMVGIGTVKVDDPQLTARHLSPEELQDVKQPQPIILDSRLDLPASCRLLRNYQNGVGKQPWLVTTAQAPTIAKVSNSPTCSSLEAAGARIFIVTDPSLPSVLTLLRQHGIEKLMVEGGARVIQSWLKSSLVDQLIVTVAPVLVGDGVDATSGRSLTSLSDVQYQQIGNDMVIAAKLQ
ncbi:dihydrofolate reductase-like domain-containing protein [Radiomyces spectabilis]|uniref:dihydrofolate reductase-like domain-containing protein n=1 Tax=Radiomyces spectabilis TaxID=64574 RepID=UPI00221ED2B7|nr:dihydrofolate reductase-like domain-containing protein [Radiomyces spectabilis]KAI8381214.1 dihydrofolate reductase-like domain-containing protein [Radiomyces spectabilis]